MMHKNEQDERNQKIFKLRNEGYTWIKLSDMFGISTSGAHYAYNKHLDKCLEKDENYKVLEKLIKQSCEELSISGDERAVTRICNCLKNSGIYDIVANNPSKLNDYSDKYFLSLKNFGEQSLMILRNIK